MRSLFAIIFLVPFVLCSQNQRFYFVEGGTCFNTKLSKSFYTKDPGTSTTSFEYKGAINTLPSYYIKGGFEKNFALCPVSKISFPVSLMYFNEAQNIKATGGYSGCFSGESGVYDINRNNHYAVFSLGIKLSRNITEKISLQNGLNLSQNLLVCEENKFKVTNEDGIHSYYFVNPLKRSCFTISTQSGVFYKTGDKTQLGLTAEYFFYSKRVLPNNDHYRSYEIYNFEQGYKGYSAILNIGLRLQHSF